MRLMGCYVFKFYLLIYGCAGSLLLCGLFSRCRELELLSRVYSVAMVHGLSCSIACGVFMDLPGSGLEPVSPARAGRFFTPEPPGKPDGVLFQKCNSFHLKKKV